MNGKVSGRGLTIPYEELLDSVDPQSQASWIALQTAVRFGNLDVLCCQQEPGQRQVAKLGVANCCATLLRSAAKWNKYE
jgi:hypothetical protein